MRAATLDLKIKNTLERTHLQSSTMKRLCHEVEHGAKQALLEHFLQVYVEKMKLYKIKPLNESYYTLSVEQGAFVVIKNVMTEIIIMWCYVDECNMLYYDEKSTHVQKRAYQYWLDKDLLRILGRSAAENAVAPWHELHGDVLRCVVAWLPVKDLLACTVVNKHWRYHLVGQNSVWRGRRLPVPPQGGREDGNAFRVFIKSSALFSSLEAPVPESCLTSDIPFGLSVLKTLAEAWVHYHRDFLHTYHFEPFCDSCPSIQEYHETLLHLAEREPQQKKLKLLEDVKEKNPLAKRQKLLNARELFNQSTLQFIPWHNEAIAKHVFAYMSGTISMGGKQAAVVWLGQDGAIRVAELKCAKGYVKREHAKQYLHKMMFDYLDWKNKII